MGNDRTDVAGQAEDRRAFLERARVAASVASMAPAVTLLLSASGKQAMAAQYGSGGYSAGGDDGVIRGNGNAFGQRGNGNGMNGNGNGAAGNGNNGRP